MAVIYARALFIPLMNNDSAHHALIAMQMAQSGDFISLMERDHDYMDKPHFLFWLVALSFKIFGISAFAYRLPSLLFSLLGLYATFRLALLLFGLRAALWAAAILSTAYAFVLANNDVRMDAVLTATIIFAIWQLVVFVRRQSWLALVLASLGMAMAFSTKGIIGIVLPMLAALLYVIQLKDWRQFKNLRWVAMGVATALFLVPVFYSFDVQFDLHPEKVIRGTTGNSGVKFLLLGQSIQRYGGTSWGASGSDDPFLFVHTLLWAFLPWSLVAYLAWWDSMCAWFNKAKRHFWSDTFFISATLLIIFLLISGSRFKLPHYLNILFPLFAIITAVLVTVKRQTLRLARTMQWIVVILLGIITVVLNGFMFQIQSALLLVGALVLLAVVITVGAKTKWNVWMVSLAFCLLFYFLLHFNFFPQLLTCQAGGQLAEIAKQQRVNKEQIYYLSGGESSYSFDFGLNKIVSFKAVEEINEPSVIYTGSTGLAMLQNAGVSFKELARVKDLHVSKFRKETLIPSLREQQNNYHYLLSVNP